MTYDRWKSTEPDDGAVPDHDESELELLYAREARLRESRATLLAAAKEAVELIKVWHNMHIALNHKEDHWRLYQLSPEMRRINAAISAAEEPAP